MKTVQQQKFEQLITSIVLLDPDLPMKAIVLEYFRTQSDHYYEIFCDKIYEFLNFYHFQKNIEGLVYITDRPLSSQPDMTLFMGDYGRVYLGTDFSNYYRLKIQLLSPKDIDTNIDDIIYYIELALARIETYLFSFSQQDGISQL